MKIIKVSDAVHKRLIKDKKHFSDVMGVPYTFDRTICEYQKCLYEFKDGDHHDN